MAVAYRMSPEVHLYSALAASREIHEKSFAVNKFLAPGDSARAYSLSREPAPCSNKLQTCPISSQLNKTQRGLWGSDQRQTIKFVVACLLFICFLNLLPSFLIHFTFHLVIWQMSSGLENAFSICWQ